MSPRNTEDACSSRLRLPCSLRNTQHAIRTDHCYLNGRVLPVEQARVSALDHGLLYGDGLFETLALSGGRPFRLQAHLERLRDGARRLALSLPWSDAELGDAAAALVRANGLVEGALRITVTRGEGPPVPDPSGCAGPALLITARAAPPPDEAAFARGLALRTYPEDFRPPVPGVKSLCYLPFQQARVWARSQGADEALLADRGLLLETATSNVFLVWGGELVTPSLDSGCLPGVTRACVLELAAELGVPVRECPVSVGWVPAAEEQFVTGSLIQVMSVTSVDGQAIGDGGAGPITRRLREAYRELFRRETG